MPVTGTPKAEDRMAECLEEITDKLDELIRKESAPMVVNVPNLPTPTVNVEAPSAPRMKEVIFTVHRDENGLIETITARPKL